MVKTYEIKQGFSFEQQDGYNLLLKDTIGWIFAYFRGAGPALFVVRHFTDNGSSLFTKGVIGLRDDTDLKDLLGKQQNLSDRIDGEFEAAREYITRPSRVYQIHDESYSVVTVKCKDGYFGCGWYDSDATSRKGLMLAGMFLYALGLINVKIDPIFWEVTYKYLPYEITFGNPALVDQMIFKSMEEDIIKQNSEKTQVRLVSEEDDDNGGD